MSGWYQSGKRRGSKLAWSTWLLLGPLLMWFPGSERVGPEWLEVVASGFHGLWFALGGLLSRWAGVRAPRRAVWIGLVVFGVALEVGQGWIPHRDPSLLDAALNAVGAALGLWLPAGRSPSTSDRVDGRPNAGTRR